jgi:hypothetical protein
MFIVLATVFFVLNLVCGLTGENSTIALWNMFAAGILLASIIDKLTDRDY